MKRFLLLLGLQPTAYILQNQSNYNEEELLQQVAKGNEAAFRQLFLHWHQLLASYVFRITESRELTEEIVQDVFLKIWMTRETLGKINHFKPYLLVVSRNQAFDVMKKQLKEKLQKRDWDKDNRLIHPAIEQEDENNHSLIDQAIESLPPRRKEVYLLSRHERLTYREIADQLGISKESVKTHLNLATDSISAFIRSRLLEFILLTTSLFKIF